MIKDIIKYGALFLGIREAGKVVSNYNNNDKPASPQPQHPPQQTQYASYQYRDDSGYVHQSWCNGQCGHHCSDNVAPRDAIPNGEASAYYKDQQTGVMRG